MPKGMAVELTWDEVEHAAHVAIRRIIQGMSEGLYDKDSTEIWEAAIQASTAEFAVAKCLGTEWTGGPITAPDGRNIVVRCSKNPDAMLVVFDREPDEDVYVLVTGDFRLGTTPALTIAGWTTGAKAKEVGQRLGMRVKGLNQDRGSERQ